MSAYTVSLYTSLKGGRLYAVNDNRSLAEVVAEHKQSVGGKFKKICISDRKGLLWSSEREP